MTTMNLEIYDALIQAKFPEKPARTIATVLDRETKKEATELKTNLKEDLQDLKVDTQATKENIKILELKIGWVKSDLIWWVVVMHLGTLAAIFAMLMFA